jgi:hypothetical protein
MPRRCSPPRGTYREAMSGFSLRLRRGRRRPGTQRRPARFLLRMLSNHILWPGMIGVAIAVGLGVQMGESAIGEINPIHFEGAVARPQGIDPAALPPPPQSAFAQAYGWEQGNAARQADSGYEDFDYVPQATVRRAAEPVWQDAAAPTSVTPWPPGQVSSHPEVQRYTDYPIEDKVIDQPSPAAALMPAAPPVAPEEKVQTGQ